MEVTELLYLLERSQAVKAHNNPEDPWEELLDLAMHDPCVRQAVDMVRYRGMSVVDAALQLALAQTKSVAILRDELVKARMLAPFPVTIPANWVTDKMVGEVKHRRDLGFEEAAQDPKPRTVEFVLGRTQPDDPEAAAYREATRECQMEAAEDIVGAVGRALTDLVSDDHAIGRRLFHEANRRIDAEINAWRIRYPDVAEFQGAEYSATAKEGPRQGAITIVWSEAFRALSQGHARVRMSPLPKHFRT